MCIKDNKITIDQAGFERLEREQLGKAILTNATVEKDPQLFAKMGIYQLRVSDAALQQLLTMFKYSVMFNIDGYTEQEIECVSDSPIIKRQYFFPNETCRVIDNRTGETVVTILP